MSVLVQRSIDACAILVMSASTGGSKLSAPDTRELSGQHSRVHRPVATKVREARTDKYSACGPVTAVSTWAPQSLTGREIRASLKRPGAGDNECGAYELHGMLAGL